MESYFSSHFILEIIKWMFTYFYYINNFSKVLVQMIKTLENLFGARKFMIVYVNENDIHLYE